MELSCTSHCEGLYNNRLHLSSECRTFYLTTGTCRLHNCLCDGPFSWQLMPCQWRDKHLVMAELVKGVGVIVTAQLDNTTRWDCHTTEPGVWQSWLARQNQSQNSMLFSMFIQKFIFVNYLATGSITLFINIVVLLGCCFGSVYVYLFDYFWRKYQSIFITDFHCAKQNKLNSAWYPSCLICIKFRLHELRLFKKTFFLYKFCFTCTSWGLSILYSFGF